MTTRLDTAAAGAIVAGRYRLVRQLATGAVSSVWVAEEVEGPRVVALKVLHDAVRRDPEVLARARAEAGMASRTRHPGVAAVFEVVTADGAPVLVSELCPGASLRALLAERGRLSPPEAKSVALRTLDALAAVHAAGVVHADLKPDNIVVDAQSGETSVKIIDFGVAVFTGSAARAANGDVFGTPEYMSPEQVRGEPLTAAADVYSMGIVLHEMLTGVVPFEAESASATVATMLTRVAPPLSSRVAGIANDLDELVQRAIAKHREKRPRSALEFRSLLTSLGDSA